MGQTPREIVRRCLKFESPERMPRELWALPWAWEHIRPWIEETEQRFPCDFTGPANVYRPSRLAKGDPYGIGTCVDEWGCTFTGIQRGVIGEVRTPLLHDVSAWRSIQPPTETLPDDRSKARDDVNRSCAATPLFVRAPCLPRPWERYQFIRTTENAMIDIMTQDEGVRELLSQIHGFYMRDLEFWVTTDVDAIFFMDDWGAQRQLLIPPPIWRDLFKPLYREYCQIAHAHGKFAFMHSDGYIAEIYPDLVEIGVDAINSQLFCMDMAALARIGKGKLTFWGEIDRQHVLPSHDPEVVRRAVQKVAQHLYDPRGGVIAQFEASPGSYGPNVPAIFEEWDRQEKDRRQARRGKF